MKLPRKLKKKLKKESLKQQGLTKLAYALQALSIQLKATAVKALKFPQGGIVYKGDEHILKLPNR